MIRYFQIENFLLVYDKMLYREIMTKKELMAIMPLLDVIRSIASEIDYYSVDYNVKDLGHLADKLREAAITFRKEVKI